MLNITQRSFGTQCYPVRSTGVQTKRLSKDEMRYYSKVIEKEKEVLLKFLQATKEHNQLHHTVSLAPVQAKPPKNSEAKRKTKRKNKRKHSWSAKVKNIGCSNEEENVENSRAHYVSKIVVDDTTQSLKLSFKPCNLKKFSSASKENDEVDKNERIRSRKLKQPRRVYRTSESQQETLEKTSNNTSEMVQAGSENTLINQLHLPRTVHNQTPSPKIHIKSEPIEKQEVTLTPYHNPSPFSANWSDELQNSSPVSMVSRYAPASTQPEKDGVNYNDQLQNDQDTSCSDDEPSQLQEDSAESDDNQSNCSEEFSIVEPREYFAELEPSDVAGKNCVGISDNGAAKKSATGKEIKQTEKNLDSNNNKGGERSTAKSNVEGSSGLPQVVSIHFYDPQSHCQRVIDPNTHITEYPRNDCTQLVLNKPTTMARSPAIHPSTITSPAIHPSTITSSATCKPLTSGHIPPAVTQTTSNSTHFHYPQHTPHATSNPYTTAVPRTTSIPNGNSVSTATAARFNTGPPYATRVPHTTSLPHTNNLPHTTRNPRTTSVPVPHANGVPRINNYPPLPPKVTFSGKQNYPVTGTVSTQAPSTTSSRVIHPEMRTYAAGSAPTTTSKASSHLPSSEKTPNTAQDTKDKSNPNDMLRNKKRCYIFAADEPPRKKVISSLLTPLCEREAVRLADGIHEVNMQYFPLRSLAQKAANRVSQDTDDVMKLIEQKIQLKTKVQDVEKARNLLKDIYDMVLKSKEIEDIQNFELVSHNFGVRNILNHLSLVDLYFGELGSELQSKI